MRTRNVLGIVFITLGGCILLQAAFCLLMSIWSLLSHTHPAQESLRMIGTLLAEGGVGGLLFTLGIRWRGQYQATLA